MSIEATAVNTIVLLVGLAGIGLACAGIRAYQRDSFRQKSFAIRDRLFDYAAAGNIAFNDPAYWELRLNMNRVIQYSHRLNFGEALLPMILRDRTQTPASSYQHWLEALKLQPENVRHDLEQFHLQLQEQMVMHLLATTPLAWIWAVPFILMGTMKDAIARLVSRAWVIEEEAQRDADVRYAQLA